MAADVAVSYDLGAMIEGALLHFACQVEVTANTFAEEAPELNAVCAPVLAGLRAELVRRWQRRGAAVRIELPENLTVTSLKLGVAAFKSFELSTEQAREAAELPQAHRRALEQASDLATAIRAALESALVGPVNER